MKKPARVPTRSHHVRRLWIGLPFVVLLAGGCKPRELVCGHGKYFEAPFGIERPGPEVRIGRMELRPDFITLKGDNHAHVEWLIYGHVGSYTDVIYSPAEGFARNIDKSEDVYPMRRSSGWMSERVQFGFRAALCPQAGELPEFCKFGDDQALLVADMDCHRVD